MLDAKLTDTRRTQALAKRKGLTVGFPPLPRGILASKKLVPWLVTHAKAAAPLVEWLVFAAV